MSILIRQSAIIAVIATISWAASMEQALTGTVLGRKGRPLAEATVYFDGYRSAAVTSAVDGSFTILYPTTHVLASRTTTHASLTVIGNAVHFTSDGHSRSMFTLHDLTGRVVRSVDRVFNPGRYALDLLAGCSKGLYLLRATIDGHTHVLRISHTEQRSRFGSMQADVAPTPTGLLKSSAANFRLVAEHPEYFSDTSVVTNDTSAELSLTRKNLNILVFGNSYSRGWVDYFEGLAVSLGAEAKVVCLRGGGRWHEVSESEMPSIDEAWNLSMGESKKNGYGALEADYSARLRGRDCVDLKNLGDYAPFYSRSSALEEAVEKMKTIDEWDVFTQKVGSKWGNDSLFKIDALVTLADSLRAHWPDAAQYVEETVACRNDYLRFKDTTNTSFDSRYLDAAEDPENYTETKHYIDIRAGYAYRQRRTGSSAVIPWATVVQNLRFDEEFGYLPFPDPNWDYYNPTAGTFPDQSKSFHLGVTRSPGGSYHADHHPNRRGNFAHAAAAFMIVYGRDIRQSDYHGQDSRAIDPTVARIIKRIAYETVAEGLMPDTTSRLEFQF